MMNVRSDVSLDNAADRRLLGFTIVLLVLLLISIRLERAAARDVPSKVVGRIAA